MDTNNENHSTPIKLIVTDIDGTLLNSDHQLTERTKKALKAASEQGVKIVLATGKSAPSAAAVVEQLGIPVYGIYLQGMLLMDTEGKVTSLQTLRPDLARRVITYAEERGFTLIAYSGNQLLARVIDQYSRDYTLPYHEPLPEIVGPLQNILWTTPIHKLIAMGEPRAIVALRWQLNAQLGDQVRLMQAGVPVMLEALPPGGGKGPALKMLLKELQIASENIIALGDAENDIEMIRMAGIGVAVGNAGDKTKEAAQHVVATNDEDGVAEAVERFVLQPSAKPEEAHS